MNIPEAMQADRTRRATGGRRQLSRRAYADLVELPEQRVWALEQGKKPKPGELEKVRRLLAEEIGGESIVEGAPRETQVLDNRTTPVDEGMQDCEQERLGLQAAYAYVLQRLHDRGADAPFAWPSGYRIEGAPCEDLAEIRTWIQSTHEWLDGVREPDLGSREEPETTAPQDLAPPEPSPEPVVYAQETIDSPTEVEPVAPSDPARPAPLDDEYRYITNGELRTWARCRRQWWFGYHRKLGLRAVQVTGAASVGTRVHRVLAEYYVPIGVKRRDPWDVFEESLREDQEILDNQYAPAEKWEKWRKEVDLARAMLEGYFEWVEETAADAGLTITAPETRLTADLRMASHPDVRLLAKLDVRAVRQPDGARLFLDHKTRADLVPKTLHLDEQMLHYHLTEYLHLLDEGLEGTMRTDGAIYNMLRKVKRSATARPPFYGRVEVRHNMDELRSYWMRVQQKVKEIEEAKAALANGQDHHAVCYPTPQPECSYQCDYFQLCPLYDDGSRAEDFVDALYVEVNPLRRYEPDKVGVVG